MNASESYQYEEFQGRKERLAVLGEEFGCKVHFDFTKLIFLGMKSQQMKRLDDVINYASSLQGYHAHRTIAHKENICHLYIMYGTSFEAIGARNLFRQQEGFESELVDDILRCWYSYEMMSDCEPHLTIGYLDTVGEVKHSDPLSEENSKNLLRQFGDPLIRRNHDGTVQVGFSSMAEGIGACIVHGQWFIKSTPRDTRFYYRVQLDKSEHFSKLVNYCNKTPDSKDTFDMEYFSPKADVEDSRILSYENTGSGHNYLTTAVPKYTKQYSRGRGGNKFHRGGRNFKQRNVPGFQYKNDNQYKAEHSAQVPNTNHQSQYQYNHKYVQP